MKFLSDIEQAKVDFYKLHPEGIIKSDPAVTVAICHRCQGHVPINHDCLRNWRNYCSMDNYDFHCPHCKTARKNIHSERSEYFQYRAIPHTIVKTVKHWTKLPKKFLWFTMDSGNYFYEYEILKEIKYD